MNNPAATSDSPALRVFVAEFLCGGGMSETPVNAIPSSLLSEGQRMWRAIVEDFSKWAKVRTPVDPRLGLKCENTAQIENVRMHACSEPWTQWTEAARDCDVSLVIIPESEGLLANGIATMRAAGVEVLAPTGAAIGLATDKWATAQWLHQAGIPHPDTWSLPRRHGGAPERRYACSRWTTAGQALPGSSRSSIPAYLVKPRDGCGAMCIRQYDKLESALAAMGPHEITQQQIRGRPASVLVIGNQTTGRSVMLPAVWQSIAENPRGQSAPTAAPTAAAPSASAFFYRGGYGPLPTQLQPRAHALVARVMQAMPGKLSGFIGVDLILGADASCDAVIEVNPRLTTSYVGLREMTPENLTQRLFGNDTPGPVIGAPPESVCWDVS